MTLSPAAGRARAWRRFFGVFLIVAAVAALVGLFRTGSVPRADFVFVNSTTPASLDPHKVTGTPEGRLLRALFEGLTVGDPATLEARPGSAERWEISPDGLTYRFFIREGLRWSNGDPLNAHDFEWSWRRCLEPATAGKYVNLLWSVAGAKAFNEGKGGWDQVGIRATSDHEFEVRLAQPTAWFLSLTQFYPLFPLHRRSVEAAEAENVTFTTPERLICNGPYEMTERWLRDRIRMRRNPHYWNAASISIETVDALAIESDNTAMNLLVAGKADWILRVPRSLVPLLRSDPQYAEMYQPTPYFGTYFMRCNVTRAPLDSVALRRAISLAIDRSEIVDSVTCAGEEPAWSIVPWPAAAVARYQARFKARAQQDLEVEVPLPWYSRALANQEIPAAARAGRPWETMGYDPERARQIFTEHGYRVPKWEVRDGKTQRVGFTSGEEFPSIEYLYNSNSLHERVGELLQAQLQRELGIEFRLANQEWGSYLAATKALEYETARSAWIGDFVDPYAFLEVFRAENQNNRTGWKNARYEELLEQSLVTVDVAERSRLLHSAEQILMDELPVIPLYYYVTDGMRTTDIGGFVGNSLDTHFPQFWYRKSAVAGDKEPK